MKVLFVIADSLRADAPGYAGGFTETPFLDSLAKEGAWFEEAFASGAWTIPSILSMLTGTLPHKLGVARWRHPFPRFRPTLLSAFVDAGFEVQTFHPYPMWGFINTPGAGAVKDSQDPGAVESQIRQGGADSFFLIHHWWTHLPYINKRLPLNQWHAACDFALESLGRHPKRIEPALRQGYKKTAEYFSEEILPRYLEAASEGGGDVLLIVTGDHGETWGQSLPEGRRVENVYDLHGRWITDETIRIPLLFHGGGAHSAVARREAIQGFARGVDVGPTIADLAGIPWPGRAPEAEGSEVHDTGIGAGGKGLDVVGESLVPSIEGVGPAPREEVVTVTSQNAHVPKTFPETGRETWRTFGLRTRRAWFVWDGIDGTRQVDPVGASGGASSTGTDEVWTRMKRMWNEAQDPGALISDEDVKRLRGGAAPESDDDAHVEARLKTLGYLD